MKLPTSKELEDMTPMMRQYFKLKSKCLDAILFFRMGDFFEVFGQDAEEIAPKINIVLTSRERGDKQRIHFCGVPHHSAHSYWLRLLRMNYKIAIADQMEDPSLQKGLVRREIVKIISPGCIDELEGLDADTPNYILAAYEHPKSRLWAVALADISTGEFRMDQIKTINEVEKILTNYRVKEILIRKFCYPLFAKINEKKTTDKFFISVMDESLLNDALEQKKLLGITFGDIAKGQAPYVFKGGMEVVGSLLFHFSSLHASSSQFRNIKPLFEPDSIALDEVVIRDLELLETIRSRKKEGSLFHQINYTLTPMGSRLLKKSITNPLCSREKIEGRQRRVTQAIKLGKELIVELRSHLKNIGDIERLSTRIAARNIRPNELSQVKDTLFHLSQVHKLIASQITLEYFYQNLKGYKISLDLLRHSLLPNPDSLGKGDGVFVYGYDQELDQHLELSKGGQEKVDDYQEKLRKETKINNLKIKKHKTYGLLIEVTKSNLMKVPESFVRKQTMVNYERFVTTTLKDLEESLIGAQDLAIQREKQLYQLLLESLVGHVVSLQDLAKNVAFFDLIISYAWLALEQHYSLPEIHQQDRIELIRSRHPVVEAYVGTHQFVANDIVLDSKAKQMIITGPNMAGKSTVMRQTALCAILCQIGSFVPADKALLPVFDNIFTRIGASDDLSRGLSTFMVEMQESSHILRHTGEHSLVILDEVGRGTSTEEGTAIATAVLEHISTKLKSWTLFATHYHEIVATFASSPLVTNYKTEAIEKDDSIQFTYRLVKGSTGYSFGLEVAKQADFPDEVLDRARFFIKDAKQAKLEINEEKILEPQKDPSNYVDLKSQEIMFRLSQININRTTPLQAFQLLHELVLIHQKNPQDGLFQDGQIFF